MHGQAYLFSLKEIFEDISVSEGDKILWVPHNKLHSFESFFLDKIYLGIKRMEMGRKLFGQ